jgi:hypothetical protein
VFFACPFWGFGAPRPRGAGVHPPCPTNWTPTSVNQTQELPSGQRLFSERGAWENDQ